jgi:hypothetical protein
MQRARAILQTASIREAVSKHYRVWASVPPEGEESNPEVLMAETQYAIGELPARRKKFPNKLLLDFINL